MFTQPYFIKGTCQHCKFGIPHLLIYFSDNNHNKYRGRILIEVLTKWKSSKENEEIAIRKINKFSTATQLVAAMKDICLIKRKVHRKEDCIFPRTNIS